MYVLRYGFQLIYIFINTFKTSLKLKTQQGIFTWVGQGILKSIWNLKQPKEPSTKNEISHFQDSKNIVELCDLVFKGRN